MLDVRAYFEGREAQRRAFVTNATGAKSEIVPLAQDWASRRYFRVRSVDRTFVLMEAVPDHIPTATMGHKLSAFIRIATLLHSRGIAVPEIIVKDEQEGYVLLEDFGDVTVNAALEQGGDAFALYTAATDILIALRERITLDDLCGFPTYKDSYIRKGMQRIVDWYIPATRKEKNGDDLLPSYLAAWEEVARSMPPPPIGFIHGDFHLQNLMLLKDGRCGVLDFQDAMAGPVSYDLANLLENIRKDVPRDIYDAMMTRYGGDEAFRVWFRVMATQFHCRIIGQVLRLAVVSGKTDLLQYMPRIQNYILQGLKDPVLKPLARWMEEHKVDFRTAEKFDPAIVKNYIRDDAF